MLIIPGSGLCPASRRNDAATQNCDKGEVIKLIKIKNEKGRYDIVNREETINSKRRDRVKSLRG